MTQKRQNPVTEKYHKSYSSSNHNGEVIDRSCLFFLLRELVFHFYRLMCANTTKCARFLIRKGIFDWKQARERLRSHEHSMKHKDATITFSRRCN